MSHATEKFALARDLKECLICGRNFTEERIEAHETICQKSLNTTRKSFDISQQRIKGTEAEKFAKVAAKNECLSENQKNKSRGLSTNWRGKRQEFINKIKDAKGITKENRLKINDLPFPPPTTYDGDYIQCQHCLRQYNQISAARHIVTCASRMCKPKSRTNLASTSSSTSTRAHLTHE